MSEKTVIIGPAGGREHALGCRLAREGNEVLFTGGNAGTEQVGINLPEYLHANNIASAAILARWLKRNKVTRAIVGSENPLAIGVVDECLEQGVPVFGPIKAAARLETSKSFMHKIASENGVPVGQSWVYFTAQEAKDVLDPDLHVVKNDGLDFGKGVEASENPEKLLAKIREIAALGHPIVLQERLVGEIPGQNNEVSVFAICDGEHAVMLPYCRDYKRVDDAEAGPNTGGMGCFTPVAQVTPEIDRTIQETMIQPLLEGCQKAGHPFKGVMYLGVMLTTQGPRLFEVNVRFGDPEAEILMLILGERLTDLVDGAIRGQLDNRVARVLPGAAMSVALCAEGYPEKVLRQGDVIYGLDSVPEGVEVFHMATKRLPNGDVVTNGGRIVLLASRGENLAATRRNIYSAIGQQGIHFAKMHFRETIGK